MKVLKDFGLWITLILAVATLSGCGGGGNTQQAGNSGTLTVTGAPQIVAGSFVAQPLDQNNTRIDWTEPSADQTYGETLTVFFDPTNGLLSSISFLSYTITSQATLSWECDVTSGCSGILVDTAAGTATFSNAMLTGVATANNPTAPDPIILDGQLSFTPF